MHFWSIVKDGSMNTEHGSLNILLKNESEFKKYYKGKQTEVWINRKWNTIKEHHKNPEINYDRTQVVKNIKVDTFWRVMEMQFSQ